MKILTTILVAGAALLALTAGVERLHPFAPLVALTTGIGVLIWSLIEPVPVDAERSRLPEKKAA